MRCWRIYEELAGKTEMNEDDVKRYRDELPRQIDDARAELPAISAQSGHCSAMVALRSRRA